MIAAATHVLFDGRPTVGASGAIMGVLGMHTVLCFSRFGKVEPFLILFWFFISLGLGIARSSGSAGNRGRKHRAFAGRRIHFYMIPNHSPEGDFWGLYCARNARSA